MADAAVGMKILGLPLQGSFARQVSLECMLFFRNQKWLHLN
jgi:hypothetical protein